MGTIGNFTTTIVVTTINFNSNSITTIAINFTTITVDSNSNFIGISFVNLAVNVNSIIG